MNQTKASNYKLIKGSIRDMENHEVNNETFCFILVFLGPVVVHVTNGIHGLAVVIDYNI